MTSLKEHIRCTTVECWQVSQFYYKRKMWEPIEMSKGVYNFNKDDFIYAIQDEESG